MFCYGFESQFIGSIYIAYNVTWFVLLPTVKSSKYHRGGALVYVNINSEATGGLCVTLHITIIKQPIYIQLPQTAAKKK